MTLSFVLFLFLAHLGVGIVFTLVLVGKEAGVKFFRFNAGLAAVLLLVALAMRPEPVRLGTDAQGVAFGLLLTATAAVLVGQESGAWEGFAFEPWRHPDDIGVTAAQATESQSESEHLEGGSDEGTAP